MMFPTEGATNMRAVCLRELREASASRGSLARDPMARDSMAHLTHSCPTSLTECYNWDGDNSRGSSQGSSSHGTEMAYPDSPSFGMRGSFDCSSSRSSMGSGVFQRQLASDSGLRRKTSDGNLFVRSRYDLGFSSLNSSLHIMFFVPLLRDVH